MIKELIELIKAGVITIRVVTITILVICGYMWIKGIPLDDTLKTSWLIILGFWFSSEVTTKIIEWFMKKKP